MCLYSPNGFCPFVIKVLTLNICMLEFHRASYALGKKDTRFILAILFQKDSQFFNILIMIAFHNTFHHILLYSTEKNHLQETLTVVLLTWYRDVFTLIYIEVLHVWTQIPDFWIYVNVYMNDDRCPWKNVLVYHSCLTLCDSMDCSPPGSCPWDSPSKNTGVGCHFLLQGIFSTQGSNLGLLYCRQSLPSEPPGKPGCPWDPHLPNGTVSVFQRLLAAHLRSCREKYCAHVATAWIPQN